MSLKRKHSSEESNNHPLQKKYKKNNQSDYKNNELWLFINWYRDIFKNELLQYFTLNIIQKLCIVFYYNKDFVIVEDIDINDYFIETLYTYDNGILIENLKKISLLNLKMRIKQNSPSVITTIWDELFQIKHSSKKLIIKTFSHHPICERCNNSLSNLNGNLIAPVFCIKLKYCSLKICNKCCGEVYCLDKRNPHSNNFKLFQPTVITNYVNNYGFENLDPYTWITQALCDRWVWRHYYQPKMVIPPEDVRKMNNLYLFKDIIKYCKRVKLNGFF